MDYTKNADHQFYCSFSNKGYYAKFWNELKHKQATLLGSLFLHQHQICLSLLTTFRYFFQHSLSLSNLSCVHLPDSLESWQRGNTLI